MKLLAFLSLSAAIISFLLANFIFYQANKKMEHKIFILICLSLTYWGFIEFMGRQSNDYQSASFWIRLLLAWPFAIALLFHFVLIFTEKTKLLQNIFIYFLIYIPALLFLIIDSTSNLITDKVVKTYWGYTYTVPKNSWVSDVANIWVIGLTLLALTLCFLYYKKITVQLRKVQVLYLTIALSFPIISGLITEVICPMINYQVPGLTTTTMSIMVLLIGYTIWKYQLFTINPATAAENIIQTIPDFLILTDQAGKIVRVNQSFLDFFEYNEAEIIEKPLEILFVKKELFLTISKNLSTSDHLVSVEVELQTNVGQKIPVLLSSSAIRNKNQAIGIVFIAHDISKRKRTEKQLKETQQQLIELAHQAGMAEVATDILHNIGNTLNSVGISTEEILNILYQSKIDGLFKANQLLLEHHNNLGEYLTSDPKGQLLPKYYCKVAEALEREHLKLKNEANELSENVAVIKEVIEMQQDYACSGNFSEKLNLIMLVDYVLKIQQNSLSKNGITIKKLYSEEDCILQEVQRSKMIHVLLNIFKNAVEAVKQNDFYNRLLTINIKQNEKAGTSIKISDNGEGIIKENLTEIFRYGFTNKENGHGFRLHFCANAMTEMGGKIIAESDGPGKGATFTLIFPS